MVYTCDQGFFLGDHGWFDKRFIYEQSIRMPFLIRWPGVIKPGSVAEAMAMDVDFAPTFLEMAGVAVPGDMQGRSIVPLLHGERPADWRKSWYYRYYHDPGDHNVRAHYGVGPRPTSSSTSGRRTSGNATTWFTIRRNCTTCRGIRPRPA